NAQGASQVSGRPRSGLRTRCNPRRGAVAGSPSFGYFSWRSKKSNPPSGGTNEAQPTEEHQVITVKRTKNRPITQTRYTSPHGTPPLQNLHSHRRRRHHRPRRRHAGGERQRAD